MVRPRRPARAAREQVRPERARAPLPTPCIRRERSLAPPNPPVPADAHVALAFPLPLSGQLTRFRPAVCRWSRDRVVRARFGGGGPGDSARLGGCRVICARFEGSQWDCVRACSPNPPLLRRLIPARAPSDAPTLRVSARAASLPGAQLWVDPASLLSCHSGTPGMARWDRVSGAQWASARRGCQPELAGQTSLSHPGIAAQRRQQKKSRRNPIIIFLQPVLMKIQSRFAYAELTNTSFPI